MHQQPSLNHHWLNCDNDYEYMYTLIHALLKVYFKILITNCIFKMDLSIYITYRKNDIGLFLFYRPTNLCPNMRVDLVSASL